MGLEAVMPGPRMHFMLYMLSLWIVTAAGPTKHRNPRKTCDWFNKLPR